jgi:hypothetical protein
MGWLGGLHCLVAGMPAANDHAAASSTWRLPSTQLEASQWPQRLPQDVSMVSQSLTCVVRLEYCVPLAALVNVSVCTALLIEMT